MRAGRSGIAAGSPTELKLGATVYRLMEFGGPVFSFAAAGSFYVLLAGKPPGMGAIAAYLSAAFSFGCLVVSVEGAPHERILDRAVENEDALEHSFGRLARSQGQRAILQGAAFLAALLALVATT
jgi:hypothetical protein